MNLVKKIIISIAALAFVVSLAYVSSHYLSGSRTNMLVNNAQLSNSETVKVPTQVKLITETAGSSDIGVQGDVYYERDFSELKGQYPDVQAWLYYEPCSIDYPVVQTEDNDKYLTTGLDGNYSVNGWIFFDYRNTVSRGNFDTNRNTIIYGHNMMDGSMFGNLSDILDKGYLNKDREDVEKNMYIYVNSFNRRYIYRIFGIYRSDLMFDFLQTDFTPDEFDTYVNTARAKMQTQNIEIPYTQVRSNDTLLTLCTCTDKEDERLVVNAVLVASENYEN